MKLERKWLVLISILSMAVAIALAGCDDSSSSNSNDSSPSYGGSIPRGDYVTAEIDGNVISIKNWTENTEEKLSFGELTEEFPDTGSSIIKVTDFDNQSNRYLMALAEGSVLGLHKLGPDLNPTDELPVYMFNKTRLTARDVKGRSFNFMELNVDGTDTAIEIGMVGFDSDSSGSLYGAAYDSAADDSSTEDNGIYSITADGFTLDEMEEQPDGTLVLWENGIDNWIDATTLTGSTTGPVVLDHGPGEVAGGGAGFAFPQVSENTTADEFWGKVGGDYFLIAFVDQGGDRFVEYFKCTVEQDVAGSWGGSLELYYPDDHYNDVLTYPELIPISENITGEFETKANFGEAESEIVQNTANGLGIFQESGDSPDFFLTFDPEGNYIMGTGIEIAVVDGVTVTGFGLGIRDRNWTIPEQIPR